ncbi:hypothetical protein AGMMS4957_16990 [Bacteroidia bacterium]|nr:hypothetical protein AGMMS4957_16990 [Bacteroidia bacterium]
MVVSAIITAATKYVDVARAANSYTFMDLPAGKYSPAYGQDGNLKAGLKAFNATLNPNSK